MKKPKAIETETRGGSCAPAPGSAKRWTKRDAMKLQSLTRQIIRMDGGDHNIRRMAYECEVSARGDSPSDLADRCRPDAAHGQRKGQTENSK